jgi:glycosyltransferase involved in cell wall biosynthesis
VRERIRRFYGREAEVVYPPVSSGDLRSDGDRSYGEFLWVGRLVPYKRPELVVEAFRGLPHRLTMVGIGPLADSVRARRPDNVEVRGWITREELAGLYARASGFLHVGEEDFGMTMVEALAAGTPVIALDAGGARDIVRDGADGFLIRAPAPTAIADAVERVSERSWDPDALAARAREFSRERFTSHMRALLSDAMRRNPPPGEAR